MKDCWKEAINNFEALHKQNVSKGDFTGVFGNAFLKAFTKDTVEAAFRATGIHPFNRDIILPSQMKPSLSTSVKGAFPLQQTSPVRAVMAAFRACPPTSFDTSPDTHTVARPSLDDTPIASTSKHTLDSDIDPALFTPSKRIRLLSSAMASTSSGSLLVSKTRITSEYQLSSPVFEVPPELPQPDWSLLEIPCSSGRNRNDLEEENRKLTKSLRRARLQIRAHELIDEGTQAQLVVQNLTLIKMKECLHAKENRKKSDRAKLFPQGKGRVLTADDFAEEMRRSAEKRVAEAVKKDQRSVAREAKKAAKKAADAAWKETLQAHEGEIERWKSECERQRAEGTLVKNLPKRPTRPLKPKMMGVSSALVENEVDASDESSDSDENDN
jgi:hypothetical protein